MKARVVAVASEKQGNHRTEITGHGKTIDIKLPTSLINLASLTIEGCSPSLTYSPISNGVEASRITGQSLKSNLRITCTDGS
jgi:hypothetical protein